ncbi:hypothetical protein FIBSPDRAFT_890972 [Athelia psychrophila]|uniref:Uncharacterized protein n=1 Tax=Athelia psychrophila TaxID=1759441 RepID=A0A166KBY8_9AGAM|nr:hypothetical protein FIBSPDRAFT_890972 [Fibularhizoctonia sp. CBS 109695]
MSYELYELQGTLLIGLTIGASLYGALCCQTLAYLRRFTADAAYIRLTVLAIWVLESVHTALVAHSVYYYVILHRGNFSSQIKPVWSVLIQMLPASMAMGFTQFMDHTDMDSWCCYTLMLLLLMLDATRLCNCFRDAQWVDIKLNKLWLTVVSLVLLSVNTLLATGMLLYILLRTRMGIRK